MALTLMVENQYSTVPKAFTLMALMKISAAENTQTHCQPGTETRTSCTRPPR